MEDGSLDEGIAGIVLLLSLDVYNELNWFSRSGSIGDEADIEDRHSLGQGLVLRIFSDYLARGIRQVGVHWNGTDLRLALDILADDIIYGTVPEFSDAVLENLRKEYPVS